MKIPNRQLVAEELVRLRQQTLVINKRVSSQRATEIMRVQFDLMVELYLTYFTNEQFRALREFYDTDMGRSIIETERRLYEDYSEQWPERLNLAARQWVSEPHTRTSAGAGLRSFPQSDVNGKAEEK